MKRHSYAFPLRNKLSAEDWVILLSESVDAFAAYRSDAAGVPVGNNVLYDVVLTNLHNGYQTSTGTPAYIITYLQEFG